MAEFESGALYPLYANRAAVMQDILRRVSHGQHHYVLGQATPERVVALIDKFDARFQVSCSALDRYYLKKNGHPFSFLVVGHVQLRHTPLEGALLSTAPALDGEVMLDARQDRLVWRRWYLLKRSERGAWTWFLTPEGEVYWRDALLAAANNPDPLRAQPVLTALARLPMFGGSCGRPSCRRTRCTGGATLATCSARRTPGRRRSPGPASCPRCA